ncbi:MAG: RNA polymerase sigma factor [Clostridia bacterium]|nr:RNA polymerase sigma factor [Clostridia bacterium]
MEDNKILDLFWSRDQLAIAETRAKYGAHCHFIAYNILCDHEDSEECVSDTLLKAWNVIPPQRPSLFKAFLTKITRNLALNRYNLYSAQKRGGGQTALVLDELNECVQSGFPVEKQLEDKLTSEVINGFLASLTKEKRVIFVKRYFMMLPIADIAKSMKISESKVKMTLFRLRAQLKDILIKEGIYE